MGTDPKRPKWPKAHCAHTTLALHSASPAERGPWLHPAACVPSEQLLSVCCCAPAAAGGNQAVPITPSTAVPPSALQGHLLGALYKLCRPHRFVLSRVNPWSYKNIRLIKYVSQAGNCCLFWSSLHNGTVVGASVASLEIFSGVLGDCLSWPVLVF